MSETEDAPPRSVTPPAVAATAPSGKKKATVSSEKKKATTASRGKKKATTASCGKKKSPVCRFSAENVVSLRCCVVHGNLKIKLNAFQTHFGF